MLKSAELENHIEIGHVKFDLFHHCLLPMFNVSLKPFTSSWLTDDGKSCRPEIGSQRWEEQTQSRRTKISQHINCSSCFLTHVHV